MDIPHSLSQLETNLERELKLLSYPPSSWIISDDRHIYDVVIIGGGMSGLAAAFALQRYGISHIKIFDANPQGKEGPWLNYARMKILRSPKHLAGPALHIPSLTFQAWFEAQQGKQAWEQLDKIPTPMWMEYLNWYRTVLNLPVENHSTLTDIQPQSSFFKLTIKKFKQLNEVLARKVVLATGRAGFGGVEVPSFIAHLPSSFYKNTTEEIHFKELSGKRIGIIGVGASAFDAAAVALEHHASSVEMFMRRSSIPNINKFATLGYPGFNQGFYHLSDEARYKFISEAFQVGIPPPFEALKRLSHYQNFNVWTRTIIEHAAIKGQAIEMRTSRGLFHLDYLIIATGFAIDGYKQPELSPFYEFVQLWKDRPLFKRIKEDPKLGRFPYLGPSFEFLEKEEGLAPFLKDLYCFNYAATLSHGLLSSDIPDISIGADRLARGIASSFFKQDWHTYYTALQHYHEIDFQEEDFNFLCR